MAFHAIPPSGVSKTVADRRRCIRSGTSRNPGSIMSTSTDNVEDNSKIAGLRSEFANNYNTLCRWSYEQKLLRGR